MVLAGLQRLPDGDAFVVGAVARRSSICKHRRAEELIPVLQPLLEQGGALTGQDYKLFVRASSANLAQLRSAVDAVG